MSVSVGTGTHDGTGTQVVVLAAGARSAVVGDRARVRATVAWCQTTGLSCDAIAALDNDEVALDPATSATLSDQLRRVGQVLRAVQVPALAWRDPSGAIAGGTFGLGLTSGAGLVLRTKGTPVVAHVDGQDGWLQVAGFDGGIRDWHTDERTLCAGATLEDDVAGALLACTRLPSGTVSVAPATSVLAGLLTTARELAVAAARSAGTLRVAAA